MVPEAATCGVTISEAKQLATSLTGEATPEKNSSSKVCREPPVVVIFLSDVGGLGSEHLGDPLSKRTDSNYTATGADGPVLGG